MKRICIVTTARSEFGLLRPVAEALKAQGQVDCGFVAGGMHLSHEFGDTIREVEASGLPVWDRVPFLSSDDTELGVALSMAGALRGYAEAF